MHTPNRVHTPRTLRRAGITALALCAALLAPHAMAQLTDWQWRPPVTTLDYDFASPYNWMVNWPYYEAASHPPTASVRGRTFDDLHDFANLSTGVTMGSLAIGGSLRLRGTTPAASLLLGNDQGSPALVLGYPGTAETIAVQSTFEDFTLFSSGSALLHASHRLHVDRVTWVHDGTLVLGASTPGPTTPATIWISTGSSLSSGFDQLEVIVGSSSAGALRIEPGGLLDASTVRVGRGSAQGEVDQLVIWGAEAQVRRSLDIGHVGGGLAWVGGKDSTPSLLQAEAANIGFTDGEAGRLEVRDLGTARFNNLTVGMRSGSQGSIDVASGGQLIVGNQFTIGGEGSATVTSDGDLQANNVSIGSWQGGHMASLTTRGATVIGDAGQSSFNDRVQMNSHSQWTTEGRTDVHGSVTAAMYGGADVGITVGSTGVLHIDGRLSVGDYHHFDPQPIGQRVVVMPGGRLEVGDRFELYATAQLSGGGTVVGNLVVTGGTVAPGMSPGHLTIDGDLRLSGGVIVIELGGLNPGTEHDVLEVLGTLTLGSQFGNGATLVLEAVDGFTPQAGQGFDFLRAGQIDGSFSALVDHTGLGLTLRDLQFAGGHIGINLAAAVPEPHAALLMLLGLIALRLRHRRAAA